MNGKRKIAIGLCVFLTLTPFIGCYISADTIAGEYIGNFTPYIHFTMPQFGGPPFAELFGWAIAFCIFVVGLIGLVVFAESRKTMWLLFMLYMTALYCGLRALAGFMLNSDVTDKLNTKAGITLLAAIISDIVWGLFCLWATRILSRENQNVNTNDADTLSV